MQAHQLGIHMEAYIFLNLEISAKVMLIDEEGCVITLYSPVLETQMRLFPGGWEKKLHQ